MRSVVLLNLLIAIPPSLLSSLSARMTSGWRMAQGAYLSCRKKHPAVLSSQAILISPARWVLWPPILFRTTVHLISQLPSGTISPPSASSFIFPIPTLITTPKVSTTSVTVLSTSSLPYHVPYDSFKYFINCSASLSLP